MAKAKLRTSVEQAPTDWVDQDTLNMATNIANRGRTDQMLHQLVCALASNPKVMADDPQDPAKIVRLAYRILTELNDSLE